LVEWKPKTDGSKIEFGEKLGDEFVKIYEEIEVDDDQGEGIGPQIELNLGTGSDPVRDFEDELFLEIEEYQGDVFEKVGEINLSEGEQTPIEPISSTPPTETLTREQPKKKRIKTTAGRFDLPLVKKFFAQQSKSSPSHPK